ncbi:MAG: hypothetical protein AAGA56_15365, partial [Myxococcota bacterium]
MPGARQNRWGGVLAGLGGGVFLAVNACGTSTQEPVERPVAGVGGGDTGSFGGPGSGEGGAGGNCADERYAPVATERPIDIIFIVDNSESMGPEIRRVESNINRNFADIIGASGLDYRVIMITNHGTCASRGRHCMCVLPPLSNTAKTDCGRPVVEVPGRFYHYDVDVQSRDSMCILLETFGASTSEPDESGTYVNGWRDALRPEAFKIFVEVTDDLSLCAWRGFSFDDLNLAPAFAVNQFQAALANLDEGQFGTVEQPQYVWHSLVGVTPNTPPELPYPPEAPLVNSDCGVDCSGPGLAYQLLSKQTGGLRFPISEHDHYDVIFQEIAKGIIELSEVPCEYELPEAAPGEEIDLSTVALELVG